MSRAVQEECIASCVRYFILPDRTHTCWCLLPSTPISVCSLLHMNPDVGDFDIFMSSMDCHILLIGFRLG